jgi:Flp pilus assembly protein TadD
VRPDTIVGHCVGRRIYRAVAAGVLGRDIKQAVTFASSVVCYSRRISPADGNRASESPREWVERCHDSVGGRVLGDVEHSVAGNPDDEARIRDWSEGLDIGECGCADLVELSQAFVVDPDIRSHLGDPFSASSGRKRDVCYEFARPAQHFDKVGPTVCDERAVGSARQPSDFRAWGIGGRSSVPRWSRVDKGIAGVGHRGYDENYCNQKQKSPSRSFAQQTGFQEWRTLHSLASLLLFKRSRFVLRGPIWRYPRPEPELEKDVRVAGPQMGLKLNLCLSIASSKAASGFGLAKTAVHSSRLSPSWRGRLYQMKLNTYITAHEFNLESLNARSPERSGDDNETRQFNILRAEAAILLQTKKYNEALICAKRASTIRPDDPRPYIQIAYALAYLKDPNSSYWAKKAISLEPDNGLWFGALADTYTLSGKWKKALEPMQKAVELSPLDPALQSGLGLCFLREGRPKNAMPFLQKAVELDPEKPDFHIQLSAGLLLLGKREESELHLKKALELKPDSVQAQVALGMRMLLEGKAQGAEGVFREALRLDPQSTNAKVGLGLATMRQPALQHFLVRYSMRLAVSRYRRVVWTVSVITFADFLLVFPNSLEWPASLVTIALFAWLVYFALSWRVAKSLGKRRSHDV